MQSDYNIMAAQEQNQQAPQYVFPPGKSTSTLEVKAGTVLTAGVIPAHVTELNMQYSKPIFEEGAIHPALKHLWVYDLAEGSHYHNDLSLFVHTYSGGPLPIGQEDCQARMSEQQRTEGTLCGGPSVFIHANERSHVSKDQEHYLFQFNSKIPIEKLDAPEYDHGEQFKIGAFDVYTLWAVKRTPKPKVSEPAVTPEPAITPVPESAITPVPELVVTPVPESVVIAPAVTELDEEQDQASPS